MMKRFVKCYGEINCAIIAATAALTLTISTCPEAGWAGNATATAQNSANAVMNEFGSSEGIRQNATVPLTGGGQMSSIDGSSQGTVQLVQPSSTAFMTMLIQPGPTGDLTTVQVMQDLNFDNTNDYSYRVPVPVSGVCANGIISCDPGTWDNCDYFKWTADDNGKVSVAPSVVSELGGCYCINSSCGSHLAWNNVSLLLQDLGGGAAGAIQQKKSGYVITQVEADGPSIAYYGQDTTSSSSTAGTGSNPQTRYLNNPAMLTSDAETLVMTQSANPDSYYSLISDNMAQRGGDSRAYTCRINRVYTIDEIVRSSGAPTITDGTYTYTHYYEYHIGGEGGDNSAGTTERHSFLYGYQVSSGMVRAYPDGPWISLSSGSASSCRSYSYSTGIYHRVSGTICFQVENGQWRFDGLSTDTGWTNLCPPGSNYESGACVTIECANNEVIANNCLSYENNTDCRLKEEIVDGVITYRNYNPTNLIPLPSNRTVGENSCINTVTRDWWSKERTYLCQSDENFNFDDTAQRVHTITSSTLDNDYNPSITYDDMRRDLDTGEWIADSGTINLPDVLQVDECQFVCKTRRLVEDTEVSLAGTTTDYQISNDSWEFLYKTCIDQTTCPTEPGEEILTPCSCIDEFAEAASVMSVLEGAANDMICSDGVER
ncbi:hypothetical protein [Desulfolithobacter dissulfuricans]|uniref:hypothetical protein n=1 Tax=Desulfolithobacter dissulfuricans TaxID=2795293 RepID=UPI00227814F4|nr:hypothetical protein [Desulfolithobacter dissulfuricans]